MNYHLETSLMEAAVVLAGMVMFAAIFLFLPDSAQFTADFAGALGLLFVLMVLMTFGAIDDFRSYLREKNRWK